MAKMTAKKKKKLRQRRIRCAVWLGAALLCGAGGYFLRDRAVGILLFGCAAASLLLSVNAWFRFMKRGMAYAVSALLVAASLAVLWLGFVGVDGRLYPHNTQYLTPRDLEGLTSLRGIGCMKSLSSIDATGLGLTGASELSSCSSLTRAGLSGNPLTLSEELALKKALPACDFTWQVPLSTGTVPDSADSLRLTASEVKSISDIDDVLSLFDGPADVSLEDVSLSLSELRAVEARYPGVSFSWSVLVGGGEVKNDDTTLTITDPITADEILDALSGLYSVDTLDVSAVKYPLADLMRISRYYPDLTILWKSDVSGLDCDYTTQELNLTGRPVDIDTLAWLVEHTPSLTAMNLYDAPFDQKTLTDFALAHPGVMIYREVELAGEKLNSNTQELDLKGKTISYDDVAAAVTALPRLQKVDLTDSSLTEEEKRSLCALRGDVSFVWVMDLFGVSCPTDAKSLKLVDVKNATVEELQAALPCFRDLTYIDLSGSNLTNDQLAQLRDQFPEKGVVWTIHVGIYSIRSNATAFSTFHQTGKEPYYHSQEFSVLKYCNRMMGLDIGHNLVDDLTWLEEMPQLKVLILADNRLTDISSLAKLKNLEYLELFVNYITDISPLAELHNLIDLNLGFNNFTDVTPLLGLTGLERLWLTNNFFPMSDRKVLREALPNTQIDFTAKTSVENGWRTHERYFIIHEMFENGYFVDWDHNIIK